MKVSVDFVTNSSSESFGTIIGDGLATIILGIPFISATLGDTSSQEKEEEGGSSSDDYAPYPSENPEDPSGTMIQKNPDGTITKTFPDGTVATKYSDGTIYGTFPDGSVGVVYPDGTEKYTHADGTLEEIYPDGSSKTVKPDGVIVTEDKAGNKTATEPNGTITTLHPDGSIDITDPAGITKIHDKDFNVVGVKDKYGSYVTKDADGNITGTMVDKDGNTYDVKGDGSGGMTIKNDSTNVTLDKDGELVNGEFVDKDGKLTLGGDGSIKYDGKSKDGKQINIDMDGDGNVKYGDADGNKFEISSDGKITGVVKDPEGDIIFNPDGSRETTNKDGSHDKVIPNPDGSVTWVHKDPQGAETQVNADEAGKLEIKGPLGDSATFTPDGSLTVKKADGTSETFSAGQLKDMADKAKAQTAQVDPTKEMK